jgi:hypothetical protein
MEAKVFTATRYCVQIFDRRNAPGEVQQFHFRDEALAVGQIAARRAVGVAVYEVTGEPVFNLWREPKMLAVYGTLPD